MANIGYVAHCKAAATTMASNLTRTGTIMNKRRDLPPPNQQQAPKKPKLDTASKTMGGAKGITTDKRQSASTNQELPPAKKSPAGQGTTDKTAVGAKATRVSTRSKRRVKYSDFHYSDSDPDTME